MLRPGIPAVSEGSKLRRLVMVELTEGGRKLDVSDLDNFESEIGLVLPSEYRSFLLAGNGGVPFPNIVDIRDMPGSPTDIQLFFGIGMNFESSELLWNCILINGGELSSVKRVPVACDSGGGVFFFEVRADGLDGVFFDDSFGESDGYRVSNGFYEFISAIRG